ncbi:TonB-dependent receptor [Undibacterium seohonense]|uniref:TonB-dependent receptor n=1 Tax=Undibacterium seohonense TaxID=1344950 RepID=A0ABR6X6N4_9BURK|nr:TonB-dependent receptor [Undibacterium seohonense]MBC3808006.1 TonB-dependent receptor [Undibacterium seohonense]
MFKKTALAQALSVAFTAAVASFAQPTFAQDTTATQRVEVTGSSIKRTQTESASPIQVIGREELAKSGKATVAEYLQTLTADGAGSLPTGFGNGFAAGSTAISLRGLGATSTLVLLNGRRMAPFARADDGQKSFTDLSTVPMEAVDRIEVLKDGASSTYGADAIAGVVNIILRRDFEGVILKGNYGISKYSDQQQAKGSLTVGLGNLNKDGYNFLFNAEAYKSDEIMNKDRADRAWIGHGDIRPWGYPMTTQFAAGHITTAGSPSPTGSLLDPVSKAYVSLPGCSALSTSSPQDPKGGCLWHQDQFRSMQPQIDGANLYARGTWQLNNDLQAYAEMGYSKRDTHFALVPPTITPTVAFPPNAATPSGVINFGTGAGTAIMMAANHPQNPYGVPVRVRYSAFDIGPSVRNANNEFNRFVVGVKGVAAGWDFDTAYVHSESKLQLAYTNMLNMAVVKASLGDSTSPYFPYYIGAQASKNPASLYSAMVRTATSDSTTQIDIVDIKASRELIELPGGMLGLAVGAEHRQEKLNNPSLSGTSNGSINASYVAAKGDTKVSAVFAELAAPILKDLELSAAVRYDKYDRFSSTTPKFGAKWTPSKSFALRGTYSEGFRAPGPAESGAESQSTGTATARDPIRCPNGTPAPGATSTDCAASVAAVKVGDPNLSPEKSKGYTLGMIWEPINNLSMSLDAWQIKRSNEINPLPYNEAAALPTAIRADNNLVINGVVVPNSGTLLISKAPYRNSSYTEIKGLDLDAKYRISMGDYGRTTLGLTWTHIASWLRAESVTTKYQFAGTHGNCDTSNCAGTPKDKINFATSWDKGDWNVTGTFNYRSDLKNVAFAGDLCASKFADGKDAPNGCTLASFTTLDLSARWNYTKNLQIFASITNLTDKIAPLDPLTYGGLSYNPMDASGAIGRYFKVGARYQF